MGRNDHCGYRKDEEDNAKNDGHPEERLLNPTPGRENTACIISRKTAQSRSLALKDNTYDQSD